MYSAVVTFLVLILVLLTIPAPRGVGPRRRHFNDLIAGLLVLFVTCLIVEIWVWFQLV